MGMNDKSNMNTDVRKIYVHYYYQHFLNLMGNNQYDKTIQRTTKDMLNTLKIKKDLGKINNLQDMLNNIFYPTGEKTSFKRSKSQGGGQYFKERYLNTNVEEGKVDTYNTIIQGVVNKILQQLDTDNRIGIGWNKSGSQSEAGLSTWAYQTDTNFMTNTKYTAVGTLDKAMNKLQSFVNNAINKNVANADEIQKQFNSLQKDITTIKKSIIDNLGIDDISKVKLYKQDYEDIWERINNIYKLNRAPVSKMTGKAEELVLVVISYIMDQMATKNIDVIMKELNEAIKNPNSIASGRIFKTLKNNIQRNNGTPVYWAADIETLNKDIIQGRKSDENTFTSFGNLGLWLSKDMNLKISKYQGSKSQGKVDVNFYYGEGYKASVKNYKLNRDGISLHSEGRLISFLSGSWTLKGMHNQLFLNSFLNMTSNHTDKNEIQLNQIHQNVRKLIFAQALGGIMNKQGNADIFILNYRAENKILVYSVAELINLYTGELGKGVTIRNYLNDGETFENKWIGEEDNNDGVNAIIRSNNIVSELYNRVITVEVKKQLLGLQKQKN